jgi:hypothetical protein
MALGDEIAPNPVPNRAALAFLSELRNGSE